MHLRSFHLVTLSVLTLLGCVTPAAHPAPVAPLPPPGPVAEAGAAEREVPRLRLDGEVQPLRYALELTVVPEDSDFSGQVLIDVELHRPRRVLWLNATELSFQSAQVELPDGTRLALRPLPGDDRFVGFDAGRTLPAGKAQLRFSYRGKVSSRESLGLFHEEENGRWYDFTSFEAQDARRAIPCFDQPNFKTPWELTLHVRRELVAVSNAPVRSETPEAGGMKAVRFLPTKPISSYLLAFGVGPFDVVEVGTAGRNRVPLRIIMAKGHLGQEKFAGQAAPRLLSILEDYFDVPYPYEKMDLLAIPVTFGFGAMENPGLVTFLQPILLLKPEDETVERQRDVVDTVAHEFAHQWFGNLVTPAWWDDLWLNEAFASWLTHKAREVYRPGWPSELLRVDERSAAMGSDKLLSARQIRQPILTESDTVNAFDGITYSKGSAVIAMFERWIGPEDFRRGVQRYLHGHAFGAATSQDFLAALSQDAHRDVATPFNTFLDQPGVPLVAVTRQCTAEGPVLALRQSRFLPFGAQASAPQRWQIPVCAQFSAASGAGLSCMLLKDETGALPLSGASSCESWAWPDTQASGYYVAGTSGAEMLRALAQAKGGLSAAERVAILSNAKFLELSGGLGADEALALAARAATAKDPDVVRAAAELALVRTAFVPEGLEASFSRYLRHSFGARGRALGFEARAGEDEETRLLRPILLELLGTRGHDAVIAREARRRAELYLREHRFQDPDMMNPILRIAAYNGDRALLEELKKAAAAAPDRATLVHVVEGLGAFIQPDLVNDTLSMVLDGRWDPRQLTRLLWATELTHPSAEVRYRFIKAHYDALAKVLPREAVGRLAQSGQYFCDPAHQDDLVDFFKDRAPRAPGGARNYAQALELVSLCMAEREVLQKGVRAYLSKP